MRDRQARAGAPLASHSGRASVRRAASSLREVARIASGVTCKLLPSTDHDKSCRTAAPEEERSRRAVAGAPCAMAMSNLYSKIAANPYKRFQDNSIAVTQTNAWVNAESPSTVAGSPPSASPISSSIVLQREGVINQPLSTPASPLSSISSPITQNFNLLTLEDCTQDPNWQATKPTIRERNAAMFNNPLMADIQFVVGNPGHTQTIPAHKYVLATGSSVFYAMFYGGLAENKKEIEVPDVEPAAFLALLRYMYCDDVKLEADTVLATLYVAKKYIVPHLARACVTFLETSLNAKNACLLLSQSRLFEEPDLMQRCWEVIDAQVSPSKLKSQTTTHAGVKRQTPCSEKQCIYRALSWNSEEDSLSENQLQRWQGRQQIDDEIFDSSCSDFQSLRCSNKLIFASYPLSLSESNCFLFDIKLNNTSKQQFSLNRTRSEPHFFDNRLDDIEVIQNITYKDSFTEDYKDSENNYDINGYCNTCDDSNNRSTCNNINNYKNI